MISLTLKPKTQRRMQRLQTCVRKSESKLQSAYTKRWARGDFDSKKNRYERRLARQQEYQSSWAPITLSEPAPLIASAPPYWREMKTPPIDFSYLYPAMPLGIEVDYTTGSFKIIVGYLIDDVLRNIEEFVSVEEVERDTERLKRRGHVLRVESLEAIV